VDGRPPHLQPNARSLRYVPGSDQSRIFVASHSDFSRLEDREVQGILRERIILVHDNPLGYDYKWDLKSFARLYDVEKKTTIHGEMKLLLKNANFLNIGLVSTLFDDRDAGIRHHQGTLEDVYNITTSLSSEECPPVNAISLPAYPRSIFMPCQFGSLASHEVARSRVPLNYEEKFQVSDVKSQLEWSLIGGRGAISSFHVDSDGLGTAVMVLEGSKYWILATGLGEIDGICSANSFGGGWNPYVLNEGDNADQFSFEGVHLQKGDML
jgi:hypothetical protein